MSDEVFLINYHLKILKILVPFAGLSIESKRRNFKDKIRSRSLFIINLVWLNTDVFGGIVWFVDGLAQGTSIVGLTRVAPCALYSCIANLKGYFFIRHEDKINEVIDKLKQLEMKICKSKRSKKSKEEERILEAETKILSAVIKMSYILNVILLTIFALVPVILTVYKYLNTKELDLLLPFLITYPFDTKDIRIWPFVYLHQIWSECVVVLIVSISDYLFYICCTFIRIQFRHIQRSVENITSEYSSAATEFRVVDLIKWHQDLIRVSMVLEMVYTEATLVNFVCSSVLICLTGFSAMASEDIAFSISFLVFLSSSLMQIFLLCYFGDILMRSSTDVGDAIYKSKWYLKRSKTRKILLLMLIRAQKPCKLTAMGFSDVNLPAFTKILSTAWSYFALLKTMFISDSP